jgi:hemoglobin
VSDEGGEAACWAHLAERGDIEDVHDVERLVRDFYRQAAMDDILGPVFEASHIDWKRHIATLVDFWSWQLLGQREYSGNPLRAHEPAHQRTPFTAEHYARWLSLFRDTVDASFEGPRAEFAKERAAKMATALRRLLSGVSDAGDTPVAPVWRAS